MRGVSGFVSDLVQKLGSPQLQNIVANLADESAVKDGRTVIDYKLFDCKVLNIGGSNTTGTFVSNKGNITLKGAYDFFVKKMDNDILNINYLNPQNANNLVQSGITDEPYRWDRIAVDLFVFDCSATDGALTTKTGQSDEAIRIKHDIAESGKLTLVVNGKELNYVNPLAFAGASIALENTYTAGVYNRKTPKYIDPAIYAPENTSYKARVEFSELTVPAYMTVVMTVSLLGYKFLKNS